ncbi:class I SAM-dependent methyltransferase [Spirosoma aerolatum]|uniref:class I SAM-dependent methyltransferase n=1 Tax=Spirosoma aerolatum TaxID=1211326 RepID=UPI001FE528AF|nr:class I SAM-dependent methyltransferase [Spirosoma aerolatum]
MDDPKRIVQQGYDRLGSSYRAFFEKTDSKRYMNWLANFVQHLPTGSSVLELGCADGIPTAQYLSQFTDYLGIDLSPIQVELARQNVPQARFDIADMSALSFPAESFNGAVALYSIIHLPLAEQPDLFKAVYQWLKPGGYFLCIAGSGEWTGTESDWIEPNTEMYWSHADANTYRNWFSETGFILVDSFFVPESNGGHTYFLLAK